ncbi:hypothetical protein K1719_039880 [Acacia pycnantha]|nr:hypothetical protein K1719_039880 [Acacia pycnantha]
MAMANDILLKPNGFDCGIFVIKFMEESDNYVKRNSLFQFDSKKERDLALKLLNDDLNQEKQNFYDKARRHYSQVEKQDGNKRLVDASKEYFEDVGRELVAEYGKFDRVNRHDIWFGKSYEYQWHKLYPTHFKCQI